MAASVMEFSPSGEFFALCGAEGTLRIWETVTNTLKQEYVPSSHLSATCTCLKWRPGRRQVEKSPSSKRKKRKTEVRNNSDDCSSDLISLGTSSGGVLVYSVVRGELQAKWDGGHNNYVNGMSWCRYEDKMYSCSSDSYIVEWDVVNGKTRQRWKADGPVYSICLCKEDSMLLSASHSIKLWDLSSRKVIQTFIGHATEVFKLMNVPDITSADSTYFLSAAKDDRYIQVWHSKNSEKRKSSQKALASLQLPDACLSMDIFGPLTDDGAYLFSVVTMNGWFLLYRQILNGECKKPLKPRVKLQIASSNEEIPKQLAVLTAMVATDERLLLAYGNPLKPIFEKIDYGSLEPENCLVRDDPVNHIHQVGEASKTKTPITPHDVKLLLPGHLVPSKPTQTSSGKSQRKRRTSVDMTVEERLDVMGLSDKSHKPNLQTTSSAILLAQGLQSKDQSIVNHVLQNKNPNLIRNTIRKLPIPLIIPLVEELSRRMQGHAQASSSIVSWTKSLLTIHSSYLMSFPELVQNLSTLYQMMESRVMMFSRLSRLQGKLELVLSQVSNQSEADDPAENIEALVTLQDESSDDDMLVPGNELDAVENWEDEESEMEQDAEVESGDEEDVMEEDSREIDDDDDDDDDDGDENGDVMIDEDDQDDDGVE